MLVWSRIVDGTLQRTAQSRQVLRVARDAAVAHYPTLWTRSAFEHQTAKSVNAISFSVVRETLGNFRCETGQHQRFVRRHARKVREAKRVRGVSRTRSTGERVRNGGSSMTPEADRC